MFSACAFALHKICMSFLKENNPEIINNFDILFYVDKYSLINFKNIYKAAKHRV